MSKQGITRIIQDNSVQSVEKLNDEGQILFEFLALIVDIRYRHEQESNIANLPPPHYSSEVQPNNVVADQISPVDDGLLRH